MSQNVGAIFVKAAKGVAEEVEKYWRGKGAKPDGKDPLDLMPLAIGRGDSERLGVAVAPAAKGWIAVRDSERCSADYSLATHLSKTLKAKVVWFTIYGVSNAASLAILEKGKVTPADDVEAALTRLNLPDPFLYFQELRGKKLKGWTLLSLSPVTVATYVTGPEPEDDEDDEDSGPPPDPSLAAYYAKLDKGLLLSDDDWEKIRELDGDPEPEVCRLGRKALQGKESRSWVFTHLAAMAILARDPGLFKLLLERCATTKKDPINQRTLMLQLGQQLSFNLFKGPFPKDWHAPVQTWLKAALPFASRDAEIHAAAAKAYARLGDAKNALEQVRLAVRNGALTRLDADPMTAPLLKKLT